MQGNMISFVSDSESDESEVTRKHKYITISILSQQIAHL